jgi:protein-tyrosine sulfotransferase
MSTISLCIVTRDSAPSLPRCIESVQPFVDEVVVLDSGMLNGSGEWAVRAGARMIPYQWAGNSAEARSLLARSAKTDWVLLMEASETLAPGAGEAIRQAIQLGGLDCGYLPVTSSTDSQDSDAITRLPRLLRRTIDLRWDEGDTESVSGWITMRARRVKTVDATIIREEEADMTEDNSTAVTEAAPAPTTPSQAQEVADLLGIARIPDDALQSAPLIDVIAQSWDRYHDDDLDGAQMAVNAAWDRIDGESKEALNILTLRAHVQLLSHDVKGALLTIERGLEWGIEHPNLYMLQGVAAEAGAASAETASKRTQLLQLAVTAFTWCIDYTGELSATDSLPGVTGWAAQTRIGSVYLAQGRIEEAAGAFDLALTADPEHAEATLGKFEALLEDGQPAAIIDGLLPFMEANIADGWMLGAAACEELGRVEDALLFVRRANELTDEGMVVAKHRLSRMQDLMSMASVYVGHPMAGPGPWGALGAILARSPLPEDAEVRPVDEAKAIRLVNHFISAGWTDMIEALLERSAEQVAPGLAEAVRTTLQAQGFDVTEDSEPEPVFMGGAWDSGIPELQTMLDAHHRILAGPEVKLVPIILSLKNEWWQTLGADLEVAGVGPAELDAAVKAFIHQLTGGAMTADMRTIESTPHSLLHMGDLGQMFPRARFIHVVRDGRSVVSSLTRRDWMDPSTGEKVWCCQDVSSAAKYWSHMITAIREQAELVPGRYMEVHYEDLMAQPEAALRKIMAFLGEPWDPAMQTAELPHRDTPETLTGVSHATVIREAGPALSALGYTQQMGRPAETTEAAVTSK